MRLSSISNLFYNLKNRELPPRHSSETVAFTQNQAFFQLAVAKQQRVKQLKAHFSGKHPKNIFISANLAGFAFDLPNTQVTHLDKRFLEASNPAEQARNRAVLEDSIIIVNNNDVNMPHYANLYSICDKTIFIGWDWDNHHWLELSTFLAAHSDIYAPAHHEHLYLLSRYNWLTCGPVYCATVQWPRTFLADHLPEMLEAERSSLPLGKHIPYSAFQFRLQVITMLNQHYASIGFSDRTFHARTPEDRFQEWCTHRLHWIIPVLNDVPIRIFDALVTGGIPIVPESLRLLPPINTIHRDAIAFYTPEDILTPQPLVAYANQLFERGGRDQLVARHRFALDHHHGDARIQQMLAYASEIFGIVVS